MEKMSVCLPIIASAYGDYKKAKETELLIFFKGTKHLFAIFIILCYTKENARTGGTIWKKDLFPKNRKKF